MTQCIWQEGLLGKGLVERPAYRMKRAVSLGSLLVLVSAWMIQSGHISPEAFNLTQDDFDLGRVSFFISFICAILKKNS